MLLVSFGLRGGAIASSVSHDSHNLIVIGDNDHDMYLAVQELLRVQGGYTLVENGEVFDTLPLPIYTVHLLGFKELLPIFVDIADFFHDIFCNDLSREHFDNMYPALLPRKSKIGFFKAKKINCVFELR